MSMVLLSRYAFAPPGEVAEGTHRRKPACYENGRHSMRRTLVALATVAVAALAPASAAYGAPDNDRTLHIVLDCGASGTVDAVFELSASDSFHVVGMGSNYLW